MTIALVYFVSIRKQKSVASSGNFLQCVLFPILPAAADREPTLLIVTEMGLTISERKEDNAPSFVPKVNYWCQRELCCFLSEISS